MSRREITGRKSRCAGVVSYFYQNHHWKINLAKGSRNGSSDKSLAECPKYHRYSFFITKSDFFRKSVTGCGPFERLWYSKEFHHHLEFKIERWCPKSEFSTWIIFGWQGSCLVQGCIESECFHTGQTKPKSDNPKSVHCRNDGESPRSVHRITRSKWSFH